MQGVQRSCTPPHARALPPWRPRRGSAPTTPHGGPVLDLGGGHTGRPVLDLGGGHGPRASDPPSRGAHVGRALCRPAPRTRGHTWLPPPALRRSRPPPPWKPQAAGRVILACARAAAAPARYRTHLARVRGDSVPHPTPESRPPATPEPHPTPRTRVLGHGRSVRSRARTCRARRPSGAAVLQQRRVPGPRTVRRSSYNTGGCTPGSA